MDSELQQLAKTDRNPIQEKRYQELLTNSGTKFNVQNGRAFVDGFGAGGNNAGEAAASFFSPTATFARGQQAKQDAFLGRFKTGMTDAISGIESELGLPQLRQNAQAAGQMARSVGDQYRAIAPTQQTVAKQVGISAPRLQQRIAAKSAEMAPTIDAASRAAEEASRAQEFGENEFGRRLGQTMKPFEVEAGMLSEGLAREFSGFTQNLQNEFEERLENLRQTGQATQADLQRLHELAMGEKEFNNQKSLMAFGTDENIRQSNALRKASGTGAGVDLSKYLGQTPAAPTYINSPTAILPQAQPQRMQNLMSLADQFKTSNASASLARK